MNRICPFDGMEIPTDSGPTDRPSGWDHHVLWHTQELDAEIDALSNLDLWALDVYAFEFAGIIRPYEPSEEI